MKYVNELYLHFRATVKKLANLLELSAKPETSSKKISLSRFIISPNIFTFSLLSFVVSSVSTSNLNSSSKSPNSLLSFG